MEFNEALKLIAEGRKLRRMVWAGNPRFIRLVDPRLEPGIDGPENEWIIMKDGRRFGKTFEEESEAKKELAAMRKETAAKWAKYEKTQKEYDDLDPQEQEEALGGIRPVHEKDYFQGCTITSIPSSKVHRINTPYFLATGRDGSVSPFIFSTVDILARDWAEA